MTSSSLSLSQLLLCVVSAPFFKSRLFDFWISPILVWCRFSCAIRFGDSTVRSAYSLIWSLLVGVAPDSLENMAGGCGGGGPQFIIGIEFTKLRFEAVIPGGLVFRRCKCFVCCCQMLLRDVIKCSSLGILLLLLVNGIGRTAGRIESIFVMLLLFCDAAKFIALLAGSSP